MDRLPNQEVTTGYNDLQQVEVLVQTAQKVVGSATITMDPEFLQHAQNAVNIAKTQLENAKANIATGADQEFLTKCESSLSQCEHQLQEALQ
ncbi:uncharacterized protein YbjT (DUF2867 family) [Bacillus fengqiuensis]|nr:uncharacterized protein YbjT (DUF2867 family) [Bacillus fengqiuensis]